MGELVLPAGPALVLGGTYAEKIESPHRACLGNRVVVGIA
jgi:hypothetical protein